MIFLLKAFQILAEENEDEDRSKKSEKCHLRCNHGGTCHKNKKNKEVCLCKTAWSGTQCDVPLCKPACKNGN